MTVLDVRTVIEGAIPAWVPFAMVVAAAALAFAVSKRS
jgi:hypothetical protein